MIKKIIACLTICFIITGIISPVFSNASALPQPNWSDPGISEIINISDLTGWMLNGGTFDVSQYTDAESFMNDYFNSRTRTRLVSPGEAAEDYYEVLPGFGINNQLVAGDSFARPLDTNRVIASSFRDHTGYGRRLSNEVNNALLSTGSLYDTKIPLLNEVEFANFVGYNHDALRLYSEFFNNENSDPTPNPDSDLSFISNINFVYLNNINIINEQPNISFKSPNNLNYTYNLIDFSNKSWYSPNAEFMTLHTNSQNSTPYFFLINNLLDIKIYTNNDDSVSVNYVPSNSDFLNLSDVAIGLSSTDNKLFRFKYNNNNYLFEYSYNPSHLSDMNLPTSFGSITLAINWLYRYFANVNIYVDDELWALAGKTSSTPTITPEFPDAIGGEDLPATTWPVHRPLAPYFITAPGMLQAIQDAIDDDGKLDIDDLKPYLTDENGDPVPDPQFDPEPVPIPVPDPVNPDVVPGLPVLPAMPPEMPGFSGVSVLAEIINFTNQSLPTALIVTFWGIVFGIVILGLIKILHK